MFKVLSLGFIENCDYFCLLTASGMINASFLGMILYSIVYNLYLYFRIFSSWHDFITVVLLEYTGMLRYHGMEH